MDTEDNYNSGEMPLPQFPERFSSPFSVNHNRFSGVRHGFNTGSNRTHPYSHVPNLIPQPYRLPPIRSVPTDNDLNNRSQHVPRHESHPSAPSISPIWSLAASLREEDDVCFNCCHDRRTTLPMQISSPDVELANQAYDVASQYVRVAVDDLLNSVQPNENRDPNEDLIPEFNGTNDNGSGRVRTISSISSMSICSSTTLQPSLNILVERDSFIDDLYYTCRDATDSYISTLRPLRHHASCSSRGCHHLCTPDARPGPPARHSRPPSLMDNISAICTHLWRRARSDVLSPRREEAATVRVMRGLYAWGEIVSRGFQGNYLDVSAESRSAMGSLSSCSGVDVWERVGEAASDLCEWLGNDAAAVACKEVLKEMRELQERENGGGSRAAFGGVV